MLLTLFANSLSNLSSASSSAVFLPIFLATTEASSRIEKSINLTLFVHAVA